MRIGIKNIFFPIMCGSHHAVCGTWRPFERFYFKLTESIKMAPVCACEREIEGFDGSDVYFFMFVILFSFFIGPWWSSRQSIQL